MMASLVSEFHLQSFAILPLYSIAHKDFGHFYGSSYVAAPDGSRTPVSRTVKNANRLHCFLAETTNDKFTFLYRVCLV